MNKLRCDICGGQIEMQPDKRGLCLNCGTSYSLATMKEMFSGVKVSVTGSNEDVEQWRQLLDRYYSSGDFIEAERIVKKILEALPNDIQASEKYEQLQVLKHMDIKNGVLTHYSGMVNTLVIPNIVRAIDPCVFQGNQYLETVTLPDGLETIQHHLFSGCVKLKRIVFPSTVSVIENYAFENCEAVDEIDIPKTVISLGDWTFKGCTSLKKVGLTSGLKRIGNEAFIGTVLEEAVLPEGLEEIGSGAFYGCTTLKRLIIPESVTNFIIQNPAGSYYLSPWNSCWNLEIIEYPARFALSMFQGTKFYEKRQREQWCSQGFCQHCGGTFGKFTGKCKQCGKVKDY